MTYLDILGLAAGILTTIEVIPQVLKSLRTRSTKDLSWGSLILVLVGLLLWLAYGIGKKDLWISLSTGVTATFYVCLIVSKAVYDKNS